MVKRLLVIFVIGWLAACGTPTTAPSGANPAVYGTQGARMVSDSSATMMAATAVAQSQQLAATAAAQEVVNATLGAMLVTRDAQDVRQ